MNTQMFQTDLMNLQENIMNFALILTANREDAQDLLQDTILKVLDNQDKYVDNNNFTGWVLIVMRNIFINNYRKTVRKRAIIDQNADLYNLDIMNDSGLNSPDEFYNLEEINKAIGDLSDELRIPFSMYLAGYKYREIAESEHVLLGTVKSRIFFARQQLQKTLEDFRK